MTREELFKSNRNERTFYAEADHHAVVEVPITRDGFEALVCRVCDMEGISIDDGIRSTVAAYVHHMDRTQSDLPLLTLCNLVRKSLSNHLTWLIGAEIKEKTELEAENAKAANSEVSNGETPV